MVSEEEDVEPLQEKKRKKKTSSSLLATRSATSRRISNTTSGGKSATTTAPQLSNENSRKSRAKSNRKIERTITGSPDSEISPFDRNKPDAEELRNKRANYYNTPPDQRSRDAIAHTDKMPYIGKTVARERVSTDEVRYVRRKVVSEDRRKRDEVDRRHTKRKSKAVEREEDQYVYGKPKDSIMEEEFTEAENDERPLSRSKSRRTPRPHRTEDSTSRRRNAPVVESRSSRRPSTTVDSRRSSYRDDDRYSRRSTTAKTTREEPRRRTSTGDSVYDSRSVKTSHVKERVLPLRRKSEPFGWFTNPGWRGSQSTVEQIDRRETSSSRHDRPKVARSVSHRESQSTASTVPPPLQRSKTTRAPSSPSAFLGMEVTIPEDEIGPKPTKEREKDRVKEEAHEARKEVKKQKPLLASIFGAPDLKGIKVEGAKKVSCLTCGSDDVPYLKTAKLSCNHRMCHDCLRRIFTMSVSDPAHMPPRCCTEEHIPLRHVDKLFDDKFKTKWNKRYQEYTTKNRLYCPARSCGEWIKPSHIQPDPHHPGRKFGKCKRCSTKVCTTCNGKYHPSNKECPKDPATAAFVEVAKQEGWQRCFNCSAMVELKEGCNHMTCRCTAEFCMICGCKWKSCDCPWFNYEAVENDRLQHMNIPQARQHQVHYAEEMGRRREQEERDEALARRLQVMGIDNEDDAAGANNGGGLLGNVIGIGNAAPNFLNDNHFVRQARNILGGNIRYAQAAATDLLRSRGVNFANTTLTDAPNVIVPPPIDEIDTTPNVDDRPMPYHVATPAPLRTPTNASRAFNRRVSRPSERVVPARDRGVGYMEERDRHRPSAGARGAAAAGGNAVRGVELVGTRDPGTRERGVRIEAWRAEIT